MATAQNPQAALAEIKPRIAALVDELVAKGADRLSIIYVIEKEADALRSLPPIKEKSRAPDEPANEWPAAGS